VNGRLGLALARLALAVTVVVVGFVLFRDTVRHAEASAAVSFLHLLGANRIRLLSDSSVLVIPRTGSLFRVVVTPSCSALSAMLALAVLGLLTPRAPWRRRLGATAVAMTAVLAGNLMRIAASLSAGTWAGRASLVLFHDWVGTMFTFASILGGYVLMLYVLLPDRQPTPALADV